MTAISETRDDVPKKVVVLDTNVLLADPNAVLSYPFAEIVIPETVLGELDKLKTARVDPDLRFRGREVSRLLFELSEEGSLVDGVSLPDGGRLRVAPFDSDTELPEGLSTRNSDDRILATAYQVCRAFEDHPCEVTLITNDLNMLLKAQTLGVEVERYGEGIEGGFAKRYIIRPFQRYRVPIGILAVALAVFVGIVAVALVVRQPGSGAVPTEFRQLLSTQDQAALDALTTLESDPEDVEATKIMADYYFDRVATAQSTGQRASAIQLSKRGIRYYDRYLKHRPDDDDARADMASLLFYSGETDQAIREVGVVLERNPKHVNANFNLGIIYLQGRRDLAAAADQMKKVIELTEGDQDRHGIYQQAQILLKQIQGEASGEATGTGGVQ